MTAPNPNSGLGQGVFGVDRNVGSGYSQQWNFTVQKTFARNLNFEVGYLGSKNTHFGIAGVRTSISCPPPTWSWDRALTQECPILTTARSPLRPRWASPPSRGSSCCAPSRDSPTSRFSATTSPIRSTRRFQMKLEKRLSHGLTFTFAYTFSKLIDDASTYFSQTIFTGPTLTTIGAADANNRTLERDVSSGDIPHVFSAGWVYQIPRFWKISGWEMAGLVRVQSGDAVPITQATNNLSAFGYAVQRPNRIANPNDFASRARRTGSTNRPSRRQDSIPSATVREIPSAGRACRTPTS